MFIDQQTLDSIVSKVDGANKGFDDSVIEYLKTLPFYQSLDTARDLLASAEKQVKEFLESGLDDMPEHLQKTCQDKADSVSGFVHTQYDNVRKLIASLLYGKQKSKRKGHLLPITIKYIESTSNKVKLASKLSRKMAEIKSLCNELGKPELYETMVKALGGTNQDMAIAQSLLEAEQAETETETTSLADSIASLDATN